LSDNIQYADIIISTHAPRMEGNTVVCTPCTSTCKNPPFPRYNMYPMSRTI